jgi:hypothetical protein
LVGDAPGNEEETKNWMANPKSFEELYFDDSNLKPMQLEFVKNDVKSMTD